MLRLKSDSCFELCVEIKLVLRTQTYFNLLGLGFFCCFFFIQSSDFQSNALCFQHWHKVRIRNSISKKSCCITGCVRVSCISDFLLFTKWLNVWERVLIEHQKSHLPYYYLLFLLMCSVAIQLRPIYFPTTLPLFDKEVTFCLIKT